VAAAPVPCTPGSIDRALRKVEAALGPLPPLADSPGPREVAPPAIEVVPTPRRWVVQMLGPLVASGSQFLELLVVFDVLSFDSLRLPNAVWRAIYAPGASSGEVVLVEQSRPDLLWPVDILLREGGNAVLSRRWRAFALGHRLRIGDHLVFRFKLGTMEASVQIFAAAASAAPTPSPRRCKGAALPR
jgi:hypothetical protein